MAATPSEQYWTSVIAEEPMTLLKITQRKLYDGESEAQMMAKYDAKAAALLNSGGSDDEPAARDHSGRG